jgi:hypothetical protein
MRVYKKQLLFAAVIGAIVINSSCNFTSIPLKGQYLDKPAEIKSSKPVDSIWLTVNRLFEANGLPIKKVDKEKAIVTSKKTSFIAVYTFENPDGKLMVPEAWVVLKQVMAHGKRKDPKTIFSEWNIRISDLGNGMSLVNVNPVVTCSYYINSFTKMETYAQSTGKFEELLESSLREN